MYTSRRFVGVTAALFIGSAALTIAWCSSMPAMRNMPMCSVGMGLSASMQDATSRLFMWLAMMVAMMLPSLTPMLLRYRSAVGATTAARLDVLTAVVGAGYFLVWTAFGALALPGASMLSELQIRWPVATGGLVLIAGALQFSGWKALHLACCRATQPCCARIPADANVAWRHGIRLGLHCVHCCFGLTLVLLALGAMDLGVMALVTAAICIERLAPDGLRGARWVGGILVAAGTALTAHAVI